MRIQDGKSLCLTKSLPAVDHFQVNFKEIDTLQINLEGKSCCLIFQVYLLCNPCFKHYFPVYSIHSLFKLFDIRISLLFLSFFHTFFLFFFLQFEAVIWIFYSMRLLFGQCRKMTSPICSLLAPEEPRGTMQNTNFKHVELPELKD